MANFNLYCLASVFSLFAVIKTGEGLRCWSCTSDAGGLCSDYFNTTQYQKIASFYTTNQNYPTLENCDNLRGNFPYSQTQKAVCMKKKQTSYNRVSYIRQCHILQNNEQVGKCPQETTPQGVTVDFCEYCDWEGCNGANAIKTNALWAALILVVITGLLRK